jgi:hypothetical protein
MRSSMILGFTLFLATAATLAAQPVASDVVTVGTAIVSGNTADVPVYIRDVASTPLGVDQPAGSHIQSYSLRIGYAPSAPIQSITFTRAGITAPLTPTFESSPSSPGTVALLGTFSESTNPIPFTLNGAAPGNLVGHLNITFTAAATPGTVVALTLDPTLTQLTDEGGSAATKETVANGTLTLVNGAVTVPGDIPALDARVLVLLAVALAAVALRHRM